jgi:hypothetical protein
MEDYFGEMNQCKDIYELEKTFRRMRYTYGSFKSELIQRTRNEVLREHSWADDYWKFIEHNLTRKDCERIWESFVKQFGSKDKKAKEIIFDFWWDRANVNTALNKLWIITPDQKYDKDFFDMIQLIENIVYDVIKESEPQNTNNGKAVA